MTQERIAELRALAEKAAPGPWQWTSLPGVLVAPGPPKSTDDAYGDDRLVAEDAEGYGGIVIASEDAEFIAAARTALPEALDEIERLRAIIAKIEHYVETEQWFALERTKLLEMIGEA